MFFKLYSQNFKERIEEMAAANISLCLAACLLAFRGLSPALHLSHLAQRRFPHTATNHSLYVVRRNYKKEGVILPEKSKPNFTRSS